MEKFQDHGAPRYSMASLTPLTVSPWKRCVSFLSGTPGTSLIGGLLEPAGHTVCQSASHKCLPPQQPSSSGQDAPRHPEGLPAFERGGQGVFALGV